MIRINFAYKNIEEKNKNEISKIDDEFNMLYLISKINHRCPLH